MNWWEDPINKSKVDIDKTVAAHLNQLDNNDSAFRLGMQTGYFK